MKAFRYILFTGIAIILLLGAFSGGIIIGWSLPESLADNFQFLTSHNTQTDITNAITADGSSMSTDELFKPFWETWDIVHDQFVDQPVNDEEMMQGAIRGMLESLGDPHTSYMDPDEFRQQSTYLEGEYEGIGAWVDATGDYLAIVSPMPDSPAEEADLKPDDLVIAVDGEDMTGKDGNYVLDHILGPAGTEVLLTIQRENVAEPFDVSIIRETIIVPSVYGELLEENVAYVQVSTFGEKTTAELKNTLKDLLAEEPVGIILDLRYNGGGALNTSIEILSQFIEGNQVVMYEEFGNGDRNEFKTESGGLATDIPLIVLVNEGSASASEITAGAIQDLDRGKLVGVTTYGKGSVQNWIPLLNDQGAIRVTIARWLTPNGRQINEAGLEPDYMVEISDEDYETGNDSQLNKAIELLQADK